MRKIFKIFIAIIALFILNNKVYAQDYSKGFYIDNTLNINNNNGGLIKGSDSDIIGDSNAGDTYFKLAQFADDNKYTIAYCSDGTKDVYLDDSQKLKITMTKNCHEVTSNRRSLIYTYEYGYNNTEYDKSYSSNKYLTGNYLKDYYITQASVWHYTKSAEWMKKFELSTNTYNGSSSGVITNITKLINDAAKAKNGAALNIDSSNIKMTLTDDKKYYISNPIKISGTYLLGDITVSTSNNNAFVTTDKNAPTGNNSFSNNSTIYVKIPNINDITKKITLKIEASTRINDSKIIECEHAIHNDSQPMIIYEPITSKLNKEVTINIDTYPIKITKKDITNSNEIEGATLSIKNNSGDIIETWISEKNAKIINLSAGTYTLEETIAPDGYKKNTNQIEFTIDSTGKILVGGKEVSEIVITNEPILVTISKRSITGSDELKGAKLKITDKNGNIVKDVLGNKLEWTSSEKAKTFQLKMGDYKLSETIAPKGYELSETVISFTINGEGKVLINGKEAKDNLIIFKNTPEPVQVETGNTLIYIAGAICIISIGISIYIIIKRREL